MMTQKDAYDDICSSTSSGKSDSNAGSDDKPSSNSSLTENQELMKTIPSHPHQAKRCHQLFQLVIQLLLSQQKTETCLVLPQIHVELERNMQYSFKKVMFPALFCIKYSYKLLKMMTEMFTDSLIWLFK